MIVTQFRLLNIHHYISQNIKLVLAPSLYVEQHRIGSVCPQTANLTVTLWHWWITCGLLRFGYSATAGWLNPRNEKFVQIWSEVSQTCLWQLDRWRNWRQTDWSWCTEFFPHHNNSNYLCNSSHQQNRLCSQPNHCTIPNLWDANSALVRAGGQPAFCYAETMWLFLLPKIQTLDWRAPVPKWLPGSCYNCRATGSPSTRSIHSSLLADRPLGLGSKRPAC